MHYLIPIILLHGLGSHVITLLPLELWLNYQGYTNTFKIEYPVDNMEFEEILEYIDNKFLQLFDKNKKIIVIGQSMGGVVANNIHKKGWKIKKSIYIGSPLHGANFINQLENILPTWFTNYMYKTPYDFLKNKEKELEPPHQYHTISLGWGFSNFDGCVYKNETILNPNSHTHLSWADHRTIFFNPRLWITVTNLIKNKP